MGHGDTTFAVVGGGIVGASIAYHLTDRGADDVTVFERGPIARETTAKSMAMFGLYGDEVQYRMKRYGLQLYNEFFAHPRTTPQYDFAGRLVLATTPEGDLALNDAMTGHGGPKAISGRDRDLLEYVDGTDLRNVLVLPELDTEVVEGAVFRPRVGYMNPRALAHEFAIRARENGARIESGVSVTEVRVDGARVTGLETSRGTVDADAVIVAAGPWNVALAESVGLELPVRHTLAPVMEVSTHGGSMHSLPAIDHFESSYSINQQPWRDRSATYLCYNPARPSESVEEFRDSYGVFVPENVPETIPPEIRQGMIDTAEMLMPTLASAQQTDEWVGIRSVTPDENPVVGWTALDGLSIAGFHTSGIQLAPKVGEVIARQLLEHDPTELYDDLSIARFPGFTDIHDGTP